jgi:hypothetical protein
MITLGSFFANSALVDHSKTTKRTQKEQYSYSFFGKVHKDLVKIRSSTIRSKRGLYHSLGCISW